MLKGDFDWTMIEAVIPVRPDIKQVSVGLLQNDFGETWFDGLSMRPVEPPALKPEVGPGIVEVKGSFQVKPEKDISNVPILFPLPLANDGQVPLTFKLWTTPATALLKSRVYEDKPGNWVCEAFLAEAKPDMPVSVKWSSMVLCAPAKPVSLPEKAAFPRSWPREVRPWLKSTYSVESDDSRFKAIAGEIRSINSDLAGIIKEAYLLSSAIGKKTYGATASQRSSVVLEKSSVCTGDANRLAAILRACGIPARILSGYFNDAVPLQTHYWVQAYIPGSGWIQAMEVAYPGTSHEFSNIYVSVVFPEYEDLAKGRFPNVADGVPYLSLNESPGCDGTFSFIGDLSSGFCDHSAAQCLSYISETSNTGWNRVMKNARKNWVKWLKSRKTFKSGILETPFKQEQFKDISFNGLPLILKNAYKPGKRKDNLATLANEQKK
ncbi:MAG TPA: transglutaminase family protein [Acidobacteriota bacterium]|nr:transglutaminase family protein [Acidobacteriota bacterium]